MVGYKCKGESRNFRNSVVGIWKIFPDRGWIWESGINFNMIILVRAEADTEVKELLDFDAQCHISKPPRQEVYEEDAQTQGPQNVQCQTQ